MTPLYLPSSSPNTSPFHPSLFPPTPNPSRRATTSPPLHHRLLTYGRGELAVHSCHDPPRNPPPHPRSAPATRPEPGLTTHDLHDKTRGTSASPV
ncbi:hypothetical protein E2C01_059600 [Portunus trituberculatus]|uniref:Uncharacterized protein n=1 Tax=Portunus trituberculatus TaxID=210409 RepID=A0A5B7H6B0_PORTR|nr:hypothetical protein [Portunus trituberculatus]